MPEVSASSQAVLQRHFSLKVKNLVESTEEAHELAIEYAQATKTMALAKERKDFAGNRLRALIGEHEGVKGEWGKATWLLQKGKLDYKAIVDKTRISAKRLETFRGPENRVLRVYVSEEEKSDE